MKKEEGRRKKEEGRRKKEEGRVRSEGLISPEGTLGISPQFTRG
jgi:hypothetical protein